MSEAGLGPLRDEVMDDDVRRKEDNPVRNVEWSSDSCSDDRLEEEFGRREKRV